MLDPGTLAAFVPAVLVVVTAPGPDTVYTLTQSLGHGRLAGVAASAGTATGVLVHTAAAVLGLSALLRTSAAAYRVVTYLGAAYLVYLGLRTFRRGEEFELDGPTGDGDRSLGRSYRKAVLVNVSNPKVAVFVLAFLPQFVAPGGSAGLQMSLLGLLYAALSLGYLACVALFAGRARRFLLEDALTRRLVRYASGSVLVGLGLGLAVDDPPGA